MIKNITFKLEQLNTPNKLLIDFGPKFFKIQTIINNQLSEPFKFPNTLFHISENRVQNLEREFKDAFALKSGMFTRQEIEAAQLLLQADEKFIDLSDTFQIERAYTNLFELLPISLGFDFRTDEIDFESWSVFLTAPVTANFTEIIKFHLNILKSVGFIYIRPTDYLTSSFYSQKSLVGAENVKHKYGILINVSDRSEIGVFDEELLENGYTQLSLGVNTVIEYCLAILRDLNIKGFKRELLEEWVQTDGTCLNDAKSVIKNIRKRDVDIKIILNSPFILFDYFKVTGMKNDVNSIPDGIITLLESNKKIKKNIKKILSNVIVVGPGSEYNGFGFALKSALSQEYGTDNINVIQGKDPTNSEINGLIEYLSTFEIYDCYNVTRIELDEVTRKSLEKQYEEQLKSIELLLKEIKSSNYYYPENLSQLHEVIRQIFSIINSLPQGLNTSVELKIEEDLKNFAKEFGKQLKSYKKSADKSLEKATENLQLLNTISNTITHFTIPFLIPLFSNQISSVIAEVRNNKVAFEEKMKSDYIKTLSKVIKKELSKESWISLDNLAQKTSIHNELILKLKDEVLNDLPDVGFLEDRFATYTTELLLGGYNLLNTLQESIEEKISLNDSFELRADFKQSLEMCSFLIKGYQFLHEVDYYDSVLVKREYLLEERKQIFGQ